MLAEFPTSGWVQAIDWSPSGLQLAWTTRDSSVHFLECSTANHTLQTVKCKGLPHQACLWVGENTLVAGGHDCVPVLFQGGPGRYQFVKDLDGGATGGAKKNVGIAAAFQNQASMGVDSVDVDLPSRHQNKIMEIVRFNPSSFATVGWDGQLIVWPHQALGMAVQ